MNRVKGKPSFAALSAVISILTRARQLWIDETCGVTGAAVSDHCPVDACQLVGRGNPDLGSEPRLEPPESVSPARLQVVERLRGHAQRGGKPVVDLARVSGVGAASGDPVVWQSSSHEAKCPVPGNFSMVVEDFHLSGDPNVAHGDPHLVEAPFFQRREQSETFLSAPLIV